MSKPVKTLLKNELVGRLKGVDSLAVLSMMGINGPASNQVRSRLRSKGIRVTVVRNATARQAFKEVGLERASELIEGPSALALGGESVVAVVRELLETVKEVPALRLCGALMEGEVFSADRMLELSKYPTRPEAIAHAAGLALAPGARLAAALLAPGSAIAGVLKTIEEKGRQAQEKGEQAEEKGEQAEEKGRQAEEKGRQAEEKGRQAQE
jgi:large subunit ribosomal protein L10